LAPFYDRLDGAARDYEAEARWLHQIFRAHEVRTVWDVACGTASHALLLAKLGYAVTATDTSLPMLRVARRKLGAAPASVTLRQGDYRRHRFAQPFDTAMCMFWTLGSHLADQEFVRALANIRRSLRPEGLFIFDVENADGIKRELLGHIFSDYTLQDKRVTLVRLNQSRLEAERILDWQAFYWLHARGRARLLVDRIKLRFFDTAELQQLLTRAGFRIRSVWGGPAKRFDPSGPSIYVVAQRATG
jgi:SAM-dependent methyltransferase